MESVSQEHRSFPPLKSFSAKARIGSLAAYEELYAKSIADPERFWADAAEELHWFRRWDRVLNTDEAPSTSGMRVRRQICPTTVWIATLRRV